MQALYQVGRAADALAEYDRARTRLAGELGLHPGPALQRLHRTILRGEPPGGGPVARPAPIRPAQLPPDLISFTGRGEHLEVLTGLLPGGRPGPPVVAAIIGTAGVGKTSLAVHWAHRVADRFPDGQLYVNLRGFGPPGRAMAPAEAVRGFLDALGVPPAAIPADPDAQAARYRELVAGRRWLVILDNARDADQIRPLLPGTPSVMVVATSRSQLTGLAAAHRLPLDVLSTVEARELLAARLGAGPVAAEPAAVDRIVTACARLPLALAIVAARAQAAGLPLPTLAAELTAPGRLDALDTGDAASQVRAVFSWSYATLSPAAARLFRLLGLHPGPTVSTVAAASLAGLPVAGTARLVTELTRANLLSEPAAGRYACHDLLRAYAADVTAATDPEPGRAAATTRLLDHYVHSAYFADRSLNPERDPIRIPLGVAADGAHVVRLADRDQAMAWFVAERPVLLAALGTAADARYDRHAWQLAWTADTFLQWCGHWADQVTAWQAAAGAADRLDHPAALGFAYRLLARSHSRVGNFAAALATFQRALPLSAQAGDEAGQSQVHHGLALLWEQQGDLRRALHHAQQFLAFHESGTNALWLARALNAVGWYQALVGEPGPALECCQRALSVFQQLGDRDGQAYASNSLGKAHDVAGDHGRAVDCYQEARALFSEMGNRPQEATTLVQLGEAYHAVGDLDAAGTAWRQALDIYRSLDHPEAEAVQARLHLLSGQLSHAG
jgi:tetratricopeptide (TPR) repeat protein